MEFPLATYQSAYLSFIHANIRVEVSYAPFRDADIRGIGSDADAGCMSGGTQPAIQGAYVERRAGWEFYPGPPERWCIPVWPAISGGCAVAANTCAYSVSCGQCAYKIIKR